MALYRLYVGSNNETKRLEKSKIISISAMYFEGFTASEAVGYWQGKPEKSLVIEIETGKLAKVKTLAKELRVKLNQQAVGLATVGKMQFI